MYYKASSVINVFQNHPSLAIDATDIYTPLPSCPKRNNSHCITDFPECEGKTARCPQKLKLKNPRGNPIILIFLYYVNKESREGKIKKHNETLLWIKTHYGLDENLLESV